MALTKQQKAGQLQELKDCLKRAKSVTFLHYIGTTVEAVTQLRTKIYERKAQMKVGKKTLFRIAAKEMGLPEPTDAEMPGAVAFVFSYEDEMSGPKAAFEFGRTNDKVKLVGGILNGKILSAAEALELGKMLSREELLAKFMAMLQAPLANFASIASSPLRSFAYGLTQVAEKKTG